MRNKYFWAALFWTIGIAICCLISMKNFERVGADVKGDKYVHFAFYFIFTILWYFFLSARNNIGNSFKTRLIVFVTAFAFGLLIEACQEYFTDDRSADIHDVVANTSGSFGAILVLWLIEKIKKKKSV